MADLATKLRKVYGNHTEADVALHREAAEYIEQAKALLREARGRIVPSFGPQYRDLIESIDAAIVTDAPES